MVVKPNRSNIINSALYGALFLVCLIITVILYPSDTTMWLATSFSFLMFVLVTVVTCRRLKFDSEGITVSLLFFNKKYLWRDVKTKRICDYSDLGKTYKTGIYSMGAEFCIVSLKKRGKKMPFDYCIFNRWFSFIFVSFVESKPDDVKTPLLYEVCQKEFIDLMKTLNIDVEYVKY